MTHSMNSSRFAKNRSQQPPMPRPFLCLTRQQNSYYCKMAILPYCRIALLRAIIVLAITRPLFTLLLSISVKFISQTLIVSVFQCSARQSSIHRGRRKCIETVHRPDSSCLYFILSTTNIGTSIHARRKVMVVNVQHACYRQC